MTAGLALHAVFNSLGGRWQRWQFGTRLAAQAIDPQPLFIIGHWRSGTTLLHELLSLDPQFTAPTTYQVYAPHHFLLTEAFVTRRLGFLMPKLRPMDNMPVSFTSPQEDEWALVNLGLPSPYLRVAFPRESPHLDYLDLANLPQKDRRRWQSGLQDFFRAVTLRRPGKLLLKSPPHTARIEALLEIFPQARFVHVVRDPSAVLPSTVRMWRAFDDVNAFWPLAPGDHTALLEQYVLDIFERMYAAFARQKSLLGCAQLVEVRFEDLVANPLGELQSIYSRLALGDFAVVQSACEKYLASRKDYQRNTHSLRPELQAELDRRWGPYLRPYGYCLGEEESSRCVASAAAIPPADVTSAGDS